jgi:hypothetical protein
MEPITKDEQRIKWLNTLVMLAQWNENLPSYFARLFSNPDDYKAALQLFRKHVRNDPVPPAPGTTLTAKEWELLYRKTTTAAPLRELFAGELDPFAKAPAPEISSLAEVSDLTTDSQTMFYSRNGTFHEVYEAVRQNPELNTQEQINEGLHKFYMLIDADKEMAEELYKLAGSDYWYLVLASLKDGRDYIPEGQNDARQAVKKWTSKLLNTELRSILLKPNSLYRVPRKLVKIAWEKRDIFDEALASIPQPQLPPEKFERRRKVANVAYPLFATRAKDELDAIAAELQLLAVVARHYISVRKFAKLDGLVYAWPKIARVAMANYPGLKIVERFFTEKPPPPEALLETDDARALFDLCKDDEALVRFFRLRPYFKDIDENELRSYRPLAPGTPDLTQVISPTSIPSPAPSVAATPAPQATVTQSRVCELIIKDISNMPEGDPTLDRLYQVTLKVANTEVAKATAPFSVQKLLTQMLEAVGASPDESLQLVLKEYFAANSGRQILFRAGIQLSKIILSQTGLESPLHDAMETSGPVRLVIATDREEVHYLPWEWLPRPFSSELWLSNDKFSLVRAQLTRTDAVLPPLRLPLKILGIFPSPLLGVRDFSATSIKSLTEVATPGALFHPLLAYATFEEIQDQLESLSPELVHLESFVMFKDQPDADAPELLISLSDETTKSTPVSLQDFANALIGAKVQLIVVGRNEMGRVYANAGPLFSHRLTKLMVPVIIAPMRAVDNVTATTFTTEFYRAFLSGHSLEQALNVARSVVASGGGDWSSFALFANPSVLDFFQPVQPAA